MVRPLLGHGTTGLDLRILIVGLGSMGKRRIRNLQRLQVAEIIGYDPRADRRGEASERYQIPTVETLDEGLAAHPDAMVVSTPPDRHVEYGREAIRHGVPFFLEASVVDEGLEELARDASEAALVAAPSCTMRFNPSVRMIKQLVDDGEIGRVLTLDHHSGQYLPDWHPWEDYRTYYVSRRATGACREIVPFEVSWLTWIFGGITTVAAMKAKTSDLDADIDDVYELLFQLEAGALGHLVVDVVSREAIRRCLVLGSEGSILWNWADHAVGLYKPGSGWRTIAEEAGSVEPGYIHAEEPYVEEMRAFVEAVRGNDPWPYSLRDDLATLRVLSAAEQSADSGARVVIR